MEEKMENLTIFKILDKEDQLKLGREKNYYGWHARKAYEELNSTKNKKTRDELIQRIHYLIEKMIEPVNELLLHNLRFVIHVANNYNKVRTSLEDKIGHGNMGLYEAILRYNPERKTFLINYAKSWITQAIQMGRDGVIEPKYVSSHLIKIPGGIIGKSALLNLWEREFMNKNGRPPTEKERQKKMKKLDLSEDSYNTAKFANRIISLDVLNYEAIGGLNIIDDKDPHEDESLYDKKIITEEVQKLKSRE